MMSDSHEVETAALLSVRNAMPNTWVAREMTGRDYGIDLAYEIFDGGQPTGEWLMFQVKGTHELERNSKGSIYFDFPVGTLKYAELFAVPVILAVVDVDHDPQNVRYVWLQDYIRVVLNYENAGWRNNTASVRLYLPERNLMPGKEAELRSIAKTPKRIDEFLQLHRLVHSIAFEIEGMTISPLRPEVARDSERIEQVFREIAGLESLFQDELFLLGRKLYADYVEPCIDALAQIGAALSKEPPDCDTIEKEAGMLQFHLEQLVRSSTMFSDYGLKHAVWRSDNEDT